ncbi:MAG TPA: NTP transferase domain-containing protein [Thermodesulfobacteriota bacterium]
MVPAFITVRSRSTRLPDKCLLPFGDKNVLEHVIRRAKHFGLEPVVCTTNDPSDDRVVKIAQREGAKYFRGSDVNKLRRWLGCCDAFGIEAFHTVDADDPFFDAELVKRSFEALKDGYDAVYPTESSKNGAASVGFSLTRDIVSRACALVGEGHDTEMMWHFLERVGGLRKRELEDGAAAPRMRLTLDYEEDYWLLATVQRIVGGNAPRQAVNGLFERNPDLHRINWFRNVEWKDGQRKKANG